ncbi:ABC transporter permease [Azospirillum sp. B4]|uniref:cell division protein FtsX n=1 Tax=Azospirillum sp. B4 TaxID=95605 RepID=UPI000349FAD7|nr:FtsX-like permease family protein [Azospirillum sp. B4]
MSRRGPAVLSLRRDATGRFLPWLIALMVFLSTLAVAAAQMLSGWAQRWDSGLDGSLTIQVSPAENQSANDKAPVSLEERVQLVLHTLGGMPGIINARPVPMEDAARLVEPWLGNGDLLRDLPLPALIDVTAGPAVDVAALRQRLAAAVPGTTVEEPGVWLRDLRRLARLVEAVALVIVALIGGAAVAVVVFAAKAGLAMHQDEVDLLHVMGATDSHVADQFQRHILRLSLTGGVGGTAVALATLAVLSLLSRTIEGTLLPPMTLAPLQWLLLVTVPVAAAALAAISARLTVLRALERLP